MRTRALLLTLSFALVGVLAGAGEVTAQGVRPSQACAKPTRVHSFHVEVKWGKRAYTRGDKAVVDILVTRPAHEDPFENGITFTPPVSFPEQDVLVSTTLLPKKYLFPPVYGQGQTDENGKVRFVIPLKRVPAGRVDATTYAEKWTNQNGCPDIEEWGHKYDSPAFMVTG